MGEEGDYTYGGRGRLYLWGRRKTIPMGEEGDYTSRGRGKVLSLSSLISKHYGRRGRLYLWGKKETMPMGKETIPIEEE